MVAGKNSTYFMLTLCYFHSWTEISLKKSGMSVKFNIIYLSVASSCNIHERGIEVVKIKQQRVVSSFGGNLYFLHIN